jgi:hypothetical protein
MRLCHDPRRNFGLFTFGRLDQSERVHHHGQKTSSTSAAVASHNFTTPLSDSYCNSRDTMPPVRSRKRVSDQSTIPVNCQSNMADQKIPTKSGSPVATPRQRSPIKKKKPGISLAQKQALIDNLQLESELALVVM